MCGITGIYHFDRDRTVNENILKRMTDIVNHRGPDCEGYYINSNVGFGHRRLSIIDLSTGDQPMLNVDKTIAVVLNGEIYNYLELRDELSQKGHRFSTSSDTEVVLKSYEEWGINCQKRFNGMWAFAIWDDTKKELYLSRDRIGEKPLHYSLHDNSFIFGSEIKSLFAYGIPKTYALEFIEIYLVLTNIPAPYSFFRGINKILPGHYIVVKDGRVEENKYWDLPDIIEDNMLTDKTHIYEEFKHLIKDSIKIRMRSDVPFGAFLSGGLDSSSVVAMMSELSKFPVKTFTIGFDDKNFDESDLALEVAKKFNTEHFRGTVTPDKFEESLNRIVFHYDEPFGDSSAIPTGYVSKFASEKVKMVLTGDGGDEVLSGYRSFLGLKIINSYNKYPKLFKNNIYHLTKILAHFMYGVPRYKLNKIINFLESANLSYQERFVQKRAYTDLSLIEELTKEIKNVIKIREFVSDIMGKNNFKDEFYKHMYINFKYDLPNDYLVKVDRMSMAHSIEARLPFLDHRLVEFMIRVSKEIKLQKWQTKSILRNTVGQKLPPSLLNAPKKGFGIPLREWFKDDKIGDHSSELFGLSNLLNKDSIARIIADNNTGRKDNGNFLWTLMVLKKVMTVS